MKLLSLCESADAVKDEIPANIGVGKHQMSILLCL